MDPFRYRVIRREKTDFRAPIRYFIEKDFDDGKYNRRGIADDGYREFPTVQIAFYQNRAMVGFDQLGGFDSQPIITGYDKIVIKTRARTFGQQL